ncbi:MAG TPA: alpha/beta hydrolase [Tepidiformaceae bacterium]|nr:alpha/beta hydrolase [Tepidiformaceae bacterium]
MASPELQTILDMLNSAPRPENPTVEQQRAGMEAFARPAPEDIVTEAVVANGIPCEWTNVVGARPERTILYLHGGGYVIGSIGTHREVVSRIARSANARALSVEYRLAPEHRCPAAVEDAVAAYRYLRKQGIPASEIVIAGDSAGGGLTVATLLALRDAGDELPAAGVCISPWVDLCGEGESMVTKANVDPMVGKEGLTQMATHYAGDDLRNPLASPLYGDLAGLPPLLIQVGTAETLLDDSTRLAGKARAAGVDVTLEEWEDMFHVWHFFAGMLPEGQQAIDRIGEFVRQRTGGAVGAPA